MPEQDKPLSGIAALITGGGGGIGGAAATWLARDGASVVIMGRSEATLEAKREQILTTVGRETPVHAFAGDALDPAQLSEALEFAESLTGRLGIAVSVIGGGTMKPLLMFDADDVAADLRYNITSAFLVIKHATPHLKKAGGGSIVCISSDAAKIPWPFLAMYNTSKAGVEGLVRGAALELAPLKIRVNAVRPGLVQTEATKTGLFANDQAMAAFLEQKPLGRTGVPDDIGAAVRYLAGPESSWVTGQSLGVEGGNELTKAPYLEFLVRKRFGDDAISTALAGEIPGER
jgi:NAD(P)-dependent dehydrogenase (short-subunit alcohol dehydrogenase family)